MAARAPGAFTVEHFRAYASLLVFDDDQQRDPEDWQLEIVADIFKGYREAWILIPEGNGKHLDVRTPLATPDGWTTMLDVQVGDQLLNADGLATNVTWVGPVEFAHDCYRVVFSDGAQITCSAEHLWEVEDAQNHYHRSVRNTRSLVDHPLKLTKRGKSGHSEVARWRIRTAARHVSPEIDLPIDPYVLGVWLGDGSTSTGRVTNIDQEVWDEVEQCGYELGRRSPSNMTKARTQTLLGLSAKLRVAGLLGNKHVPAGYLICDEDARWRLLQGLIDSDGTVSAAGQVTFSTTSTRLADDVRNLVWSLGLPCHRRSKRAVLDGVDYGLCYELVIACDARHPVACLSRKLARLKAHGHTCDHRRIVAIERVTTVPVRCLEVEADDSLYLAGEALIPTHNTTFIAQLALYGADYTTSPWIPVGASSAKQARITYDQAEGFVTRTPGMNERFRCFGGYIIIKSKRNGGKGIEIFAHDPKTGDGVIPFPYAIVDELHRHDDLRLYNLWKGKLRKRGAQILTISTAGEPETEFENTRDTIRNKATKRTRDGSHLRAEGPGLVLHEWMVSKDEDCADMDAVKAANPLWAITPATLGEDYASPTMNLGDWKRLKCNRPTRSAQSAITDKEWEEAQVEVGIPGKVRVDLGIDVAFKWDTTAIVPLWVVDPKHESYRALVKLGASRHESINPRIRLLGTTKILEPPRDGSSLHPDEIKTAIQEFNTDYTIETVVMDMSRAEDVAAWIEDELGCVVVDRGQTNVPAVENYDSFMKGLREGTLFHTGDSGLRSHVLNAIARLLPGGDYRFDRPSTVRANAKAQDRRVIDALTAASMVVQHSDKSIPKRSVYEDRFGSDEAA